VSHPAAAAGGKFEVAPGGIGFLDSDALGREYTRDPFMVADNLNEWEITESGSLVCRVRPPPGLRRDLNRETSTLEVSGFARRSRHPAGSRET
jgi:hypothetical protein